MNKKPLIVGNWKMNPSSLVDSKKLLRKISQKVSKIKKATVVVCPPSLFLLGLKGDYKGSKISFGLQNISSEKAGAYTGEVSANMLSKAGGKFVILGHSERRAMGETDDTISKKIKLALSENLTPVICIGEKVRDTQGEYLLFLKTQISETLSSVSKRDLSKIIIAYEPVWAIGEGSRAMTPRDVHETVLFLRKTLSDIYGKKEAMETKFLYGGSVDFSNARAIMIDGDVDGFLVGRASLDADTFVRIIESTV
jgi:triosephosphate isomerase (TIM)